MKKSWPAVERTVFKGDKCHKYSWNSEINAGRGISKLLMGNQRRGQLMLSVRPGECFPEVTLNLYHRVMERRGGFGRRQRAPVDGAAYADM